MKKQQLLERLPEEWPEDLLPEIRRRVAQAGDKIAVLDDDPTGTQTVHGVPVLTGWSVEALTSVLREPGTVFYISTNSRSLPLAEARHLNRTIAANLKEAGAATGRDFVVVSRSDSTLRGHYPGEVEALAEGLGQPFDGTLLVPFFLEGGRLTIDDVHYVAEGDRLVPAGETEFARDASFGYKSSNLREWVGEKHGGRVRPEDVQSISLQLLRTGGPPAVAAVLERVRAGQVCVVNAASYRDLEVVVAGLLAAEGGGKRFIYRTAASFVRVRGGIQPRGPLTSAELATGERGPHPNKRSNGYSPAEGWDQTVKRSRRGGGTGGLIVAGSYVQKSTRQIETAQARPGVASVEVSVERLLDKHSRAAEIRQAAGAADSALRAGQDALVFTSRRLLHGSDQAAALEIGRSVSAALVAIVQALATRPAWVIAKGGITSSDVAAHGLGIQRAEVLGQAIAGVPVWRTGPESRWPGLLYVVFPGNVGGPEALSDMVRILRSDV